MKKRCAFDKTEIKDLYQMFEDGLTTKQIEELTGRAKQTISGRRRLWANEKKAKAEESKKNEEQMNSQIKLEETDYARSYLSGDQAVIRSDFEISRYIRICSKKTGIMYEMSKEQKVIRITFSDGSKIELELGLFEKFVDEGIDVYIEMTKTF